jgi:hypothetical protein
MTIFFVIIAILVSAMNATLFSFLHKRVEKLSQNQALIVTWCETLRENEESLLKDFRRVVNEYKELEKEVKRK